MGITRYFIYLLLPGVVFVIAANFVFDPAFVFVVYNLSCGALLVIDYFISPGELPVKVEFCGEEKLFLHEREPISFKLYNKTPYKLKVELKDELPDFHFQTEGELMSGIIAPGEKEEFKYYLVPTKRGAFSFENVYIKFSGRLNLCTKHYKKELKREFKVYPNRKNISKYRLMMFNNRLYEQGRREIRRQGKGTSFESLREYVFGDDYKDVNWKATARLNKPITNQYQPEKNQHVYILLDTGRPMSYKIKGYRKLDLVINTVVVLSDIIDQKGDQSAVFTFNTEVRNVIMPGKGPKHRNKIMETLYKVEATNETSNYREAIYQFKQRERHRSIIFLFTDFETEEEAENILQLLPGISKNNIVIVPLLEDKKLERITKEKSRTDEDIFNKGVALELLNERQRIINLLNRRGIFSFECPPEELDYRSINKYIEIKNEMHF